MEDGHQGLTYAVDLVLVIDATGSMSSIIERVKGSAVAFHADLEKKMAELGRHVDTLRVRVIAFRDFYADTAAESLVASEFFTLPDQASAFASFVRDIRASGGGDEPETAMEGLAEAIRSPWAREGAKQRQVIIVWTDASAHPLEKKSGSKPSGYPTDMPANFDELTDMWEGQTYMNMAWKRLLLYTPDAYPWTDMANSWENCINFTSSAGEGLADMDYSEILDSIARSV
jgi:von Willebrand factor type A domain